MSDERNHHANECYRCLDTYQHETIQDAAQWLLKERNFGFYASGAHVIHQIDYEKFTTMDEVFEAYSKASEATKQFEAEQRSSLPAGSPNNSDIFTETPDNTPKPEQFNFYVHHRPSQYNREIFYEAQMNFKNGKFEDPAFNHFEVIPETVQQAYYKTMVVSANPATDLTLIKQ